jgi:hypothetical protein
VGVTIPLSLAAFAVFAVTESRYSHTDIKYPDCGWFAEEWCVDANAPEPFVGPLQSVDANAPEPSATPWLQGLWAAGSWLEFAFLWLMHCIVLVVLMITFGWIYMLWFHDRLAIVSFEVNRRFDLDPDKVCNASAVGKIALWVSLSDAALGRLKYETWSDWFFAVDVLCVVGMSLMCTAPSSLGPRFRVFWLGAERMLQAVSDKMDSIHFFRFLLNSLVLFPATLAVHTWRPDWSQCVEITLSLSLFVQEFPSFHCNVLHRCGFSQQRACDESQAFDRLLFILGYLTSAIEFPVLFSLCQGLRMIFNIWEYVKWRLSFSIHDVQDVIQAIEKLPTSSDRAAKPTKPDARLLCPAGHTEGGCATTEDSAGKRSTLGVVEQTATATPSETLAAIEGMEAANVRIRTLSKHVETLSSREKAAVAARDAALADVTKWRDTTNAARAEAKTLREAAKLTLAENLKDRRQKEKESTEKEALQHRITEMTRDSAKVRQTLNAASAQHEESAELRRVVREMTAESAGLREVAESASIQRDTARAETETSRRAISEMTAKSARLREAAEAAREAADAAREDTVGVRKLLAEMTAELEKAQAAALSVGATAPRAAEHPDAIVDVLRRIGIERNAALFAKHEIDREALFLLDTNDLKEIGLPFGAIVRFRKWMERNATLSSKDAKAAAEAAHESECVVCMERRPVQCALVPCGHLSVCLECSGGLATCPICRRGVERVLPVFPP